MEGFCFCGFFFKIFIPSAIASVMSRIDLLFSVLGRCLFLVVDGFGIFFVWLLWFLLLGGLFCFWFCFYLHMYNFAFLVVFLSSYWKKCVNVVEGCHFGSLLLNSMYKLSREVILFTPVLTCKVTRTNRGPERAESDLLRHFLYLGLCYYLIITFQNKF